MLFIIDMQNDFVDQEKGRMAIKGSEKIIKGISELIKEYEKRNDIIFYTVDIHENMDEDKRTKEEKEWGQHIVDELRDNLKKHKKIEKTYHAISPEDMVEIKDKYDDDEYTENIEIVGVETHICVLSNAVVLRNAYPHSEIIINEKLCTSSDMEMHDKAIEIMKKLRMKVRNENDSE